MDEQTLRQYVADKLNSAREVEIKEIAAQCPENYLGDIDVDKFHTDLIESLKPHLEV